MRGEESGATNFLYHVATVAELRTEGLGRTETDVRTRGGAVLRGRVFKWNCETLEPPNDIKEDEFLDVSLKLVSAFGSVRPSVSQPVFLPRIRLTAGLAAAYVYTYT